MRNRPRQRVKMGLGLFPKKKERKNENKSRFVFFHMGPDGVLQRVVLKRERKKKNFYKVVTAQ